MRLDLLVPRGWRLPSKEALRAWYARRGYRLAGTAAFADVHPDLVSHLATPCDVEVHEKRLRATP